MPKNQEVVITCEMIQGGLIFSTLNGDRRVIGNKVDAISVFVKLIHGERLSSLTVPATASKE